VIAEITAQIISQALPNASDFFANQGTLYHLSASVKTTWYGFAKAIFAREIFDPDLQSSRRKLQRLIAITSQEYPTAPSRLGYSLLDNQKLSHDFKLVMPDWERILELLLA
jgi:dTDP-4-dehydrorhamnose reductase